MGMTNGEKIIAILKPRKDQIKIYGNWVEIEIQKLGINFSCELEWWNAEYKEPKTGHWITKDGKEQGYDIGGVKTWYIQIMCSECGFIKTAIEGHTGQYHYCPNCGADMREVEDANID